MDFRIADTFTDSLARLTGEEQKAIKTTAFDLQMNPASPGMQFHKLDRAKDKGFASVRVSADIRIIVHRSDDGLLLCYVDHHDKAYAWAERRKIERHPKTGAAQMVEIRETVREIEVPRYVEAEPLFKPPVPKPPIFAGVPDDDLLSYGVPTDWLGEVRKATEDTLLDLTDHLPKEASEALLELATGNKPKAPATIAASVSAFAHPDAQRRFRVMTNVEELQRALEYPWDKWAVFLHPAQRDLVERRYNGPVRVSGSAGTGKTIVAIHRAVFLARSNPKERVLLTTFSPTLARFLRQKLDKLVGNEPRVASRIDVVPIGEVGAKAFAKAYGEPRVVSNEQLRAMLSAAAKAVSGNKFTDNFLVAEWNEVVDAWQIDSWDKYRGVQRLGRKTRLSEQQRKSLWSIFEDIHADIAAAKLETPTTVFIRAAAAAKDGGAPFRCAVVDECQDLTVAQLRFLAAVVGQAPDGLFFAGDLGQRIFQTPFSWKSLGVDIRGRSFTLRINYRTSHQIRRRADTLLPGELADVDGVSETRRGTISVFNGPDPEVIESESAEAESKTVAAWIRDRLSEGLRPEEIGVFVRSSEELPRAEAAIRAADGQATSLDSTTEVAPGTIAISTMHLAKGLEFRAVVVMAVDDGVVPLESRIAAVADNADLEEVYNTERHLLYVACTRARDRLLVSGVSQVSEFLDDLRQTGTGGTRKCETNGFNNE